MKFIGKIVSLFDDFRSNLKSLSGNYSVSNHSNQAELQGSANRAHELDGSLKEQLIKFYVEGNPLNLIERDELFYMVAHFVVLTRSCSISAIQREFSIGLSRAKLILDQIESAQIISPFHTDEGRKVLINDDCTLRKLIQSLPHLETENSIEDLDAFYEKYKEEIETLRKEHGKLHLEELKKTEAELVKLMKLEKILKKRLPETVKTVGSAE